MPTSRTTITMRRLSDALKDVLKRLTWAYMLFFVTVSLFFMTALASFSFIAPHVGSDISTSLDFNGLSELVFQHLAQSFRSFVLVIAGSFVAYTIASVGVGAVWTKKHRRASTTLINPVYIRVNNPRITTNEPVMMLDEGEISDDGSSFNGLDEEPEVEYSGLEGDNE
jgi:hypothetical protein